MKTTKKKINRTGYRILLVLQLLMQHEASKEDIIKAVSKTLCSKEVSADTVRLDINTLKSAGFFVECKEAGKNSCYRLAQNPISIKLLKSEILAINQIKEAVFELEDWKYIFNLYKVFEKISKFIEEEEFKNKILDFKYFSSIDFSLLRELDYHCSKKHEIAVLYNSPLGIKSIRIRCREIKYDRNTRKIHLWGEIQSYKYLGCLRADKIICIENIIKHPLIKEFDGIFINYKIKRKALETINLKEDEKILSLDGDSVTIKTKVRNNFNFLQHLALLGENVLDIDADIKKEMLKKLQETRDIYK